MKESVPLVFKEVSVCGTQAHGDFVMFLLDSDDGEYYVLTKIESFNYWYLMSCYDFNKVFWCSYDISKRKGFVKNLYVGLEECPKFKAFRRKHPEEFI